MLRRHYLPLAAVVLAIGGALVWSEKGKVDAPVGPEPIVSFVADTERELSRLPVKFAPLSDAEEIKIGKELETRYLPNWRHDDDARDHAIEAYVQEVGGRLAAHAHRKIPYRFHYIPSLDFVNAFALPGGPVFIGGGLMALMDTEDELAAVLGHEIEHIDHFHCAERVQVQAALQKVPLGSLVGLPVEVFVAGYSKNEELEADREGTKLAVAALYSPQGAIQMFRAFEKFEPTPAVRGKSPQEEISQVALQTLQGYFRSHPLNAERIDQIQKMIAGGQLPDWQKTKPMATAYLFLTERAWRSLQAAQVRPYAFLPDKEKRKRDAERTKQFQEAVQLASQSLSLRPDQPRAQEIIAVAHIGLAQYDAAIAIYRQLLASNPSFADGIRSYADSMGHEALLAELYDQSRKLATVSLEMQPNRVEALKVLAEAEIHLGDLAAAAAAGDQIKAVDAAAAAEVSAYTGRLAATKLAEHHYSEAAQMAAISVNLKPDQWESVSIMAKARFALADFSAAATAYRKLLNLDPSDMRVVRAYAEACSAAELGSADFRDWASRTHPNDPALAMQIRIEAAGWMIIQKDERPAQRLVSEFRGEGEHLVAPEYIGRLAWWYYRAGKYSQSSDLLSTALAQRPGDSAMQAALGFDRIEQHQPEDAVRRFAPIVDGVWNSPLMGRAVARWQMRQTVEALQDYATVVKSLPEWQNPRWVKALYSPDVAETVGAMQIAWQARPPAAR